MIIRITFKDGKRKFLSEEYPNTTEGFRLHDNINEAHHYDSLNEFKVAYKSASHNMLGYRHDDDDFLSHWKYKDVVKFESIDNDLNIEEFNINEKNDFPDDIIIYVNKRELKALMRCRITSSHTLYYNDEIIGFLEKDKYDKVNKIKYYVRGISDLFSCVFLYRNHTVPFGYQIAYEDKMFLLYNEDLQNIYLSDLDSCKRITIYCK